MTLERDSWHETASGLLVPERRPTCVDLFAGAGGFSVGFTTAGFDVVGAVETDPYAAITYCVNLARQGVQFHFDTPERRKQFEKRLRATMHLDNKSEDLVEPVVAGSGWIRDTPYTGCRHFWVADVREALR